LLKLTLLLFSCGNQNEVTTLTYIANSGAIDESDAEMGDVRIYSNAADLTLFGYFGLFHRYTSNRLKPHAIVIIYANSSLNSHNIRVIEVDEKN
jgi:hypothetical protein